MMVITDVADDVGGNGGPGVHANAVLLEPDDDDDPGA